MDLMRETLSKANSCNVCYVGIQYGKGPPEATEAATGMTSSFLYICNEFKAAESLMVPGTF